MIYHGANPPQIPNVLSPTPTMSEGDIWRVPKVLGASSTSSYVSQKISIWHNNAWLTLWEEPTGYHITNMIQAMLMITTLTIFAAGSSPGASVALAGIPPNIGDMWIGIQGELYEFDGVSWLDRIQNPNTQIVYPTKSTLTKQMCMPWLSTPFYDVFTGNSTSQVVSMKHHGDILIIPGSPVVGSLTTCESIHFWDGVHWLELYDSASLGLNMAGIITALLSPIAYNIHTPMGSRVAVVAGIATTDDLWIGANGEFCLYDGTDWINILTLQVYTPVSVNSSNPPHVTKTPPHMVSSLSTPSMAPAGGFYTGDIWLNPSVYNNTGVEVSMWTGNAWEPIYTTSSQHPYLQSGIFNLPVLNNVAPTLRYVLFLDPTVPPLPSKRDVWIDPSGEPYINDGVQWIPLSSGKMSIPNSNSASAFTPASPSSSHMQLAVGSATLLTINSPTLGMLVEIKPDGTINYGPNYTPDAAAKLFWQAIASTGLLTPQMQQIQQLQQQLQQYQTPANTHPPSTQAQTQVHAGTLGGLAGNSGSYPGASQPTGSSAPSPTTAPDDAWARAMKGL